ncbi:FUSC family protein [Nocardioides pantholopis]|uniref:FUSC family protein n=1 Tax=Nocardioides pantholopis TaxID=2483798 RepID=UPI000F0979A5|nr:FUSC family protein [Nocardioides pantholopis]
MEEGPFDRAVTRGRTSVRFRLKRLASKRWQIGQAAVAAGLAWFIAADIFGHEIPFLASTAALLGLGTTYGQRLRRVAEITIGVAIGVFIADLFVLEFGSGGWQILVIVALSMSAAFLLDGGQLFVNQAAIQGIVVSALLPEPGQAFTRWTDAVIGGCVALAAATLVPAAPLRRPREQAAVVMRKIATLLRTAGQVMEDGEVEKALDLLADARATDHLIRELQDAADEGMSVVASSPFRHRHRRSVRRMADLVDPLDRALRSTRVLVRQTAVAAYHRRPVPSSYSRIALDLADAAELVANELAADRMAVAARPALMEIGAATGHVERASEMTAEGILLQLRSVVVDLLLLSGLSQAESSDALPPTPR